jgi:hypothetical protein
VGCCFAGERIDQIEQGISGFPKAPIDLVTKVVQCVSVHGRMLLILVYMACTLVRISTPFEAKRTRISAKR